MNANNGAMAVGVGKGWQQGCEMRSAGWIMNDASLTARPVIQHPVRDSAQFVA